MSSFLTDVLVTAGQLEKVVLYDKVVEIQEEITKLKYQVRSFLDDNYIEFSSKLISDQIIVSKAEKLTEEMKILQKRINEQVKIELSGSTKELENLFQMLKESNVSLQLSNELLSLHECIKLIRNVQEEKDYIETAKALTKMKALLDKPDSDLCNLEIYAAIIAEYSNMYSSFVTDASYMLHERIVWTGTEENKDNNVISLSITNEFTNLHNLICALDYLDELSSYLCKLSTTLLKSIIEPIINYHCSVYVVKECAFNVEVLDKKQIPSYNSVLYNLRLLFKFLHQHFNITIDDNQSFLRKLQSHLLEQLANNLTENCISKIIPSSSSELKNFETVVKAICEFQNYLVEIGFITHDQLFLTQYTENIDKLFVDRICQDFLAKARNIIKKDLHDSIKYEPQEALLFSKDSLKVADLNVDRKLSESTFELPMCQISKSAKEILDLAKEILDETCRCPETCAIRLFNTCRNVFEMYVGLVPEHHKKFLETIPQQVALFHNNCMYLAHHLLTLAHEYRDKLPEPLQQNNLTFVDQTVILRDVGSELFLEHMRYQRNIIIEILKESGLSTLGQTSSLHLGTERSLRQCIRQLELLKTVWLDVLPINIYCKAVGCITNSMIEDLILRVISVEDIPADVATELTTLFTMVSNRVPLILPDSLLIRQYVRKWGKFLELIKVLAASLKEIEIRWGHGKGPLAQEFLPSQVKQLIRALFQNTERRSNLLVSIK